MANTVKLKRGSGSDPSASDLVLGELAIRTDNGKIFLKKDDNSVAEVSGGGGVDDGDKGDITVSSSGATWTIDSGVIDNANINASAAIAGSKISPDFGSQNITTTGNLTTGHHLTISGTDPRLQFTDSNNNPDFTIWANAGLFQIDDATNSANRLKINSDGHIDIPGNLDLGAGVDVTGNITVSGTVDGRDVATDGTKLDGIESGATADQTKSDIDSLGIAASTAATLVTARTIAGTSFNGSADIDISYANLTNKLSVGDGGLTQNNFTNTLKSKLDGIATGATNVSNTNQLTNGAGFITATLTNEQVQDIVGGMVTGNTESGISVTYQDGDGTLDFSVTSQTDNNFTTTLKNKLDGIASSATNVTNNNQLTNGAGYITATLTEEQVEDYVGGMVTGNSESGITVTYQDSDGTLDFSVASQTDNNFTTTLKNKLDGIAANANNYSFPYTVSSAASNSTVVQRHSSGYIFANYFNTTPNDISTGSITKICAESGNDGYIRHASAAAVRSFLNVASGATNVTNNNQLSNGAGYITGYTNNYLSSASFNTGNGVITFGRSGLGNVTVDIDGRYMAGSSSQLARKWATFNYSGGGLRRNYGVSSSSDCGGGCVWLNFSSVGTSRYSCYLAVHGENNHFFDSRSASNIRCRTGGGETDNAGWGMFY